jgi:DNA polymerase-1
MAFPKRSELGQMVRSMFVALPGWEFGAWDHGQIELRVMADDAQDAAMISELQPLRPGQSKLNAKGDMHIANAAMFFNLDGNDEAYWAGKTGKKSREFSKTLTYGMGFLGGARTLHFTALCAGFTGYDEQDFQQIMDAWWAKYHGVRDRVQEVRAFMERTGYAEDRWGRRRKLPAIWLPGNRWPNVKLREEALRQGYNLTIQGGAQGFMKRAMVRAQEQVFPKMAAAGFKLRHPLLPKNEGVVPALQIHDELMTMHQEGAWETLDPLMQWAMTDDSWMMAVPIVTDAARGRSWADL